MVVVEVEKSVMGRPRWVDWEVVMPLKLKELQLVMPFLLTGMYPMSSYSGKAGMGRSKFLDGLCKAEISADGNGSGCLGKSRGTLPSNTPRQSNHKESKYQ
jgi:hypothetical protein